MHYRVAGQAVRVLSEVKIGARVPHKASFCVASWGPKTED